LISDSGSTVNIQSKEERGKQVSSIEFRPKAASNKKEARPFIVRGNRGEEKMEE
jgi:hypothetical protein